MFNELRDTDNKRTIVTYIFALTCLAVTSGCLIFTNLQNVFSGGENATLVRSFSFIFYHGFDDISSIAHLALNLYFLLVIGTMAEKVLGSLRYLLIMVVTCLVYGSIVYQFDLYGPAATGIIWSLAPIVGYALMEGRRIKTRTMYEEQYTFLRLNLLILITVIPIFNIFLQFFLRGNISHIEAVYHGLLPFAVTLVIGVLGSYLFQPHIKKRLKSFNRRKKLDLETADTWGHVLSLIFPLYVLLVLFLHKYQ